MEMQNLRENLDEAENLSLNLESRRSGLMNEIAANPDFVARCCLAGCLWIGCQGAGLGSDLKTA